MNKIVLVTDSGLDIPKEYAEHYQIRIVRMHVNFGEVSKPDGTFPVEEIITYHKETGKTPTTSGCNVEDYYNLFEMIHAEEPEAHILYLAYSAVTTVSYNSAMIAAEGRDYVHLLDTKQVSVGGAAVVIRVAQLIEEHPEWTIEDCLAAAKEICEHTYSSFSIDTLEFLRAGGRLSNAAAICGAILSIHPRVEMIDGYLKATGKYRGKMSKVFTALLKDHTEMYQLSREELYVGYTVGFSEEMKELARKAVADLGYKKLHLIPTGGVISAHGGPGAFLIAGFSEK